MGKTVIEIILIRGIRTWLAVSMFLLAAVSPALAGTDTITQCQPTPCWKNQVDFPDDAFCASGDSGWVKFTILLLEPYDSNVVYFQDCQQYVLHYDFSTAVVDPFVGMAAGGYYAVTLYAQNQQASLGTVIMPPMDGSEPKFAEYGIQFIRQDPYTKEEIADMFNQVKANIVAGPNVVAFYFPTYEQREVAEAESDWFEAQGIPVSSTSRWAEGNPTYSQGWALGEVKYVEADQIDAAYQSGALKPGDILLTNDIPAEIPYVAGILSLAPATPSSHVAILAQTYNVPFVHLAIAEDANTAQQLVGHRIVFSAYEELDAYDVRLLDVEGKLTEEQMAQILELKKPPHLDISPIAYCGSYSANTDVLTPNDVNHFGGKGSNFGILRTSIPDNSPVATVLSFDLWNDFLDQPIVPRESVIIQPGGYLLFWADEELNEGPMHADFGLRQGGNEDIGLYDTDGVTLTDGLSFGPQGSDVSYGRLPDGNDNWVYFTSGTASPNQPNGGTGGPTEGLFINEFMADNDGFIQDNFGDYDDWIEIYNAGPNAVDLGGMYLTDDLSDPTEWMIPFGITGSTLREEINNRLSKYTYPPIDMAALSADLSAIRSFFKDTNVTSFSQQLQDAVIATLQDPNYNFDPNSKLRFRSSTNVEDSEQFTGAGLYSSHSGCLADELDGDDYGPCLCDPNKANERGVFRAIRRTLASFYNDNAFLERLRHDVNEAQVGMAVLVHHSFPDEIELSNGVATLEKRLSNGQDAQEVFITLVTQAGAVSVTNPEGGSIPEEVNGGLRGSGGRRSLVFVRASNLVPLGATVMDWEQDYWDLIDLLVAVSNRYKEITGKTTYVLDLEYKKVAPGGMVLPAGGLVVKQVRPIPQPNDTPTITPFLLSETADYTVFPGEFKLGDPVDIFATHRLKSRWTLETKSCWLDEPNIIEGFYTDMEMEYWESDGVQAIDGQLPLLPFAEHSFDESNTYDSWRMHHLANPRTYTLQTNITPRLVSQAECPIFLLSDLARRPTGLDESRFSVLRFNVEYDTPVRAVYQQYSLIDPESEMAASTSNQLYLWRVKHTEDDLVFERSYTEPGVASIATSFYVPPPAAKIGNWMAVTAPGVEWIDTVIDGFTTHPIVLHDFYSQTFHPWHHNIFEYYLFEPRLEPGISQDILDELEAQDIRLICLIMNCSGSPFCTTGVSIETFGFDYVPGDYNGDYFVDFVDFAALAQWWLETDCKGCGGTDLTGDGQIQLDDLDEFTDLWLTGIEQHISGDINNDGTANSADFAVLAGRWLDTVCDDCAGADLTGDGNVDEEDLAEFTENWLKSATMPHGFDE
ncbi:MAG: dockerin type I domain-containing protein [Planctomycetota bacterium]